MRTIATHLLPRTRDNYDQRIPKIIWQTMKTNVVPDIIADYAMSWIEGNPEYEYRLADDREVERFIKAEFPVYLTAYRNIRHGAVKADFWRYLVLYKFGGVYADMDCRCVVPLRQWIDPNAAWVTDVGGNRDVCHWMLITIPGNPIFKRAIEKSAENLMRPPSTLQFKGFRVGDNSRLELCEDIPPFVSHHPIMTIAGPPVLQQAAEDVFKSDTAAHVFKATQIVSGATGTGLMKGNVIHNYRNEDYLQALKELSTPHYEDAKPRFSRLRKLYARSRGRLKRLLLAMRGMGALK